MNEEAPAQRIAVFVPNLEGGGAELVMVSLANAFRRAGVTVDLVLQNATGPFLAEVSDGVNVVNLRAPRISYALLPLVRYLRSARPQAMLSTPLDASVLAVAASAVAGVPIRLVVREAVTASADESAKRSVRSRTIALLRGPAYRRAAHVIAPSSGVARDLVDSEQVAEGRITIIPNPIDIERIRAMAGRPPAAASSGERIIVGVGRLTAQKDFAMLIRAFARMPDAGRLRLLLLGEGDLRESLSQVAADCGVADRVSMPGFVANPFAYMAAASVFALSSRYEGLPNALLQALAVGLPVVATDCPSGPREILEDGKWGRLVPIGDADAMADALTDALAGRLATPSTAELNERFGIDFIARRYLGVLLPAGSEGDFAVRSIPGTFSPTKLQER